MNLLPFRPSQRFGTRYSLLLSLIIVLLTASLTLVNGFSGTNLTHNTVSRNEISQDLCEPFLKVFTVIDYILQGKRTADEWIARLKSADSRTASDAIGALAWYTSKVDADF